MNNAHKDEKIETAKGDEILKRMLKTPHKPHIEKSPAKAKKKGDGPTAKKNRHPQEG